MSKSNQLYMETIQSQPDNSDYDYQYFEWLAEQEYEDYITSKYGSGLAGRTMLRTGESKDDDNQEI